MAWFFILIFLSQSTSREELFFSNPEKYRIYYFNLRNEYLKKKDFENLYKISKRAVQYIEKNYIFYSDFLLSRYLTGRKTGSLIDSIGNFFKEDDIKRILFLIMSVKHHEIVENTVKRLRKIKKNEKAYCEILYRVYLERNDYSNAFRELKKFKNENIIKIELRRISKRVDFNEIEKEFRDKEEFYPVLAEIALLKGFEKKAINYFVKSKNENKIKEYLEKNPSYIIEFTWDEKDPLILYYRAKALEKENKKKKALEIYKKIQGKVKKYEDDINYSIARIYLEKRNLGKAEKEIGKIKNRSRKNEILAFYNLLKGKPEKNFEILKNINTPDGLFYLSLSSYFSKNFAKAETTFFKFIENFPGDRRVPEILFLSYLLINFRNNLKRYVEIHYKIFKGEDIKPPVGNEKLDFLYEFLYAKYMKQRGDFEKSLKLFEEISQGEEIPEIIRVKSLMEIGEIYEKKDKDRAREIYREILIKYPDNPFFPYIQGKIKEL